EEKNDTDDENKQKGEEEQQSQQETGKTEETADSSTVKESEEDKSLEKQDSEEDVSDAISAEDIYSAEETREKAMEMMEQDRTYSKRTRTVSKTQAFINAVSDYAVSVAEQNNLYASVMIAQAA